MALLPDGDLVHRPKHIVVYIFKINQTCQMAFALTVLLYLNVDALGQVFVPFTVIPNQGAVVDVLQRSEHFLTLRLIQFRIESRNRRFHFGCNKHIGIRTQGLT